MTAKIVVKTIIYNRHLGRLLLLSALRKGSGRCADVGERRRRRRSSAMSTTLLYGLTRADAESFCRSISSGILRGTVFLICSAENKFTRTFLNVFTIA